MVANNPENGECGLVPEHCLQLVHDPEIDHEKLKWLRQQYGTFSQIPRDEIERLSHGARDLLQLQREDEWGIVLRALQAQQHDQTATEAAVETYSEASEYSQTLRAHQEGLRQKVVSMDMDSRTRRPSLESSNNEMRPFFEAQRYRPTRTEFSEAVYHLAQQSGAARDRSPVVEGESIDLNALRSRVDDLGGFDQVDKEHLWTDVARQLSFSPEQYSSVGAVLKKMYITAIAEPDRLRNEAHFRQQGPDTDQGRSALDEESADHRSTLSNLPELTLTNWDQGRTEAEPLEQLEMVKTMSEVDHAFAFPGSP